jgi:cytochrome c553
VTDEQIKEIAEYYSRQTPPLLTEPRRVTILSAQ